MTAERSAPTFRLLFILGAPRSGTTMLERMLSAHSLVKGGPERHLLTPLAHLGYWRNVDKAPYDHIVAALGQRAFVESLPHQAADYWRACRYFCDSLYGACMRDDEKRICLDKTPEYATIWPFLTKVYPDAKYVVLTRHPGAILSSFTNSFFDGDYDAAQQHDPILARYVPALAGFLRQQEVSFFHMRYEELVTEPAVWIERLSDYLEIPFEAGIIDYGSAPNRRAEQGGLGDPITVDRHLRPSEAGMNKWAVEFAADPVKLELFQTLIARLNPADLEAIGYPLESLWQPLDSVGGTGTVPPPGKTAYRMKRKLIVRGRQLTRRSQLVRKTLGWLRLGCDVLLREY